MRAARSADRLKRMATPSGARSMKLDHLIPRRLWISQSVAATFVAGAVMLAGSVSPARAQVTEQTFRGGRTSDLARLCAAQGGAEPDVAARAWCHGFIIGAGQYHNSLAAARPHKGADVLLAGGDADP